MNILELRSLNFIPRVGIFELGWYFEAEIPPGFYCCLVANVELRRNRFSDSTHYYNCEVDQLEIEFCVKVNLESSKERKKSENIIHSKSCLSCPFERQSDYQARNLDSSHSLKRYLPSLNAGHLDNDILVCPKGGLFLSLGPCCLDREAVFKWADR